MSASSWKTIRVFISSTFKDMHAERDHLVRFVFPKLREELLKWRVHLEDVDLRWGVTTDQDAFDLCMTEIENCHPRFLCMLGGRYGWVPPPREIASDFLASVLTGASGAGELAPLEAEALRALYAPADDAEKHRLKPKPTTQEAVADYRTQSETAVQVLQRAGLDEARRSITASEIYYGALDRLQIPAFRYFYFRKDSVTDAIPEPFAKDYREAAGSPAEGYLADIKRRIKDPATLGRVLTAPGHEEDRPLTCHEYPCQWDAATSRIVDLKEFGAVVYDDLLASVKAQFGDVPEQKEAQTDEEKFAEEAEQMEAFIEERTQRYILGSREPLMREMLAFATADGTPNIFVLTGEPGSGKSALLAQFTREISAQSSGIHHSSLIIPHFVGASTGSTDLRRTLGRLCHELAKTAQNTKPLPLDIKDLITHFQKLLAEAAATRRVILVFDALNQFDASDGAHWLNWLPRELPPGVRIVASVIAPVEGETEHQTLAILRNRKDARVEELKPLNETDTLAIIEGCLKRYSKRLSTEQITALNAMPASNLPLYVLTALEELRTLGTYEEITARIQELPGDARALFGWILTERLAIDPGFRDREGRPCGAALVEKFAACLGVSRHGLSPAELTALLDPGDPLGNVAALLRLLRPYHMRRGELLDFYHGQFREAAGAAHLDTPEKQRAAHQSVAICLQAFADPHRDGQCRDATPHALSELPHHQTRAEAWPDLIETLCGYSFVEAKVHAGMLHGLGNDYEAAKIALYRNSADEGSLRRVSQWHQFIAGSFRGFSGPEPFLQVAHNWTREGDVLTAAKIQAEKFSEPWLRLINSPDLDRRQHCLRIFTHDADVTRVIASADGRRVIAAEADGRLRIWDIASGTFDHISTMQPVCSLGVTPDDHCVVIGSENGTIGVWDLRTGKNIQTMNGGSCVAVMPNGTDIVTAADSRSLQIRSITDGRCKLSVKQHMPCPEHTGGWPFWLASAQWDKNQKELHSVNKIVVTPDSRVAISSSNDSFEPFRVWDLATGECLRIIGKGVRGGFALAVTPDGKQVVFSGNGADAILVCDIETGQLLKDMKAPEHWVVDVAVTPDGRHIVSGGLDKLVRV